ncbi:hypothetical protein [Burkholderia ambifaria]|uniref:hypothetical protein n=1 Tax=Burkholderia ambifaria TaxID=152480 RepID=UPI00158F666F|nr:hypothetical protein [Burkholderia ambifaria]
MIGIAGKLVEAQPDLGNRQRLATALAVLAIVCVPGHACHVWVEQPMRAALNRRLAAPSAPGPGPDRRGRVPSGSRNTGLADRLRAVSERPSRQRQARDFRK